MAHHKRKRARQHAVGSWGGHIPKNNSAARTKPKDREVRDERIIIPWNKSRKLLSNDE